MSTAKARDAHAKAILGPELYSLLPNTNVLLVGAGGIGCELLKNIVLTGFGKITLLDLDTIDISNLNRQFLFRKKDVKQSKALVAAQTAAPFNPNVRIIPIHDNVKEPQYDVQWFKQFDIVLNALDNLDARRHVNKMCMAAQVPLVESGTAGYLGQVQPLLKDQTECFDCIPKPTPKTFPVCTIRSTPSQPIHCIVWSKSYLMGQLFGEDENEAAAGELDDALKQGENEEEIATLRKEAQAFNDVRAALRDSTLPTAEASKQVFDKVFNKDIQNLLIMKDMWKSRAPPIPLVWEGVVEGHYEERGQANRVLTLGSTPVARRSGVNGQSNGVNGGSSGPTKAGLKDQKVLTLGDNLDLFVSSTNRLAERLRSGKESTISFDKDDEDTLNFVTASSNLRSYAYGIDGKTRWEVKEMAGNIIPAIATTNAIISGLIVLQALHILRLKLKQPTSSSLASTSILSSPTKHSATSSSTSNGTQGPSPTLTHLRNVHLQFKPAVPLSTIRLSGPNPECGVCRDTYVTLQCDVARTTLGDVVKGIVGVIDENTDENAEMNEFNEDKPTAGREVSVYEAQRVLSDPDWDDNYGRTLESLNVTRGKFLNIVDEDGDWSTITIGVCDLPPNHRIDASPFILPSPLPHLTKKYKPPVPKEPETPKKSLKRRRSQSPPAKSLSPVIGEDGVIDLEPSPVKKKARVAHIGDDIEASAKKRGRAGEGEPSASKKRKLLEEDGLVILDAPDDIVDDVVETVKTASLDADVIIIDDD